MADQALLRAARGSRVLQRSAPLGARAGVPLRNRHLHAGRHAGLRGRLRLCARPRHDRRGHPLATRRTPALVLACRPGREEQAIRSEVPADRLCPSRGRARAPRRVEERHLHQPASRRRSGAVHRRHGAADSEPHLFLGWGADWPEAVSAASSTSSPSRSTRPRLPIPAPWENSIFAPALIRWRIVQGADDDVALDESRRFPEVPAPACLFNFVYAPGTFQNRPGRRGRYSTTSPISSTRTCFRTARTPAGRRSRRAGERWSVVVLVHRREFFLRR